MGARSAVMTVAMSWLAACGSGSSSYECTESTNCTQAGLEGRCRPSTLNDKHWCAYPDAVCESGERWGVLAGDGLAETCVDEPGSVDAGGDAMGVSDASVDAGPSSMLTVDLSGSGAGTGRVRSTPDGIDCPGACSATFASGKEVVLSTSEAPLLGWSGACSQISNATCALDVNGDVTVTAHFGTSGSSEWVRVLADTGGVGDGRAASIDGGDVVFAAGYSGSATFAGEALPGTRALVLARLGGFLGDVKWSRSVVGTLTVGAVASTGDTSFVAGTYEGSFNSGTQLHIADAATNIFLLAIDNATGNTIWSRSFGRTDGGSAPVLAVSSTGHVYLGATFAATVSLGGATFTPKVTDAIVAKFEGASGTHVWSRASGGEGADTVAALAVDATGNLLVSGLYAGMPRLFDSPVQPQGGIYDAFVTELRGSDGQHLHTSVRATASWEQGTAVTAGPDGSIYWLVDDPQAGYRILHRFSSTGTPLWDITLAEGVSTFAAHLQAGSTQLFIDGSFSHTLTIGRESVVANGAGAKTDVFRAVLQVADGTVSRLERFGGAGSEVLLAAEQGPAGQRVLSGTIEGQVDLAGEPVQSIGSGKDNFVISVAP